MSKGKTYSVEFPRLSNDEMNLYYGKRDSSGKMNWKKANQKFETKKKEKEKKEYYAIAVNGYENRDTSRVLMKNKTQEEIEKEIETQKKEFEQSDKIYNPISLEKFGWINCDRLFNPKAKRTNVIFCILNKVEEVNYVNVYLIFKDIKSIMSSSYCSFENKIEKDDFDNIPIGMNIRFFAVSYQHGKIFAVLTKPISIKDNHNEKLSLKEMNENAFDKLLKQIEEE
jgi:hypothetical protein